MTATSPASPRERILEAALTLLERGGVEAVSTRAVSAAAEVQVPTLYRQFGDMQGLLDAVASAGYATYLQVKTARASSGDPVADLRAGWDGHVAFGLEHPHLYALMYAAPRPQAPTPAAREAAALLRALLERVAAAGKLALGVDSAAAMIHAAAVGVTLTSLKHQPPDPHLSERMREAVLGAVLVARPGAPSSAVQPQAAAHAVALVALLPGLETPFSAAEQALLIEWLARLSP
ncbi:TetR/AcrR family transcriptional regulator [Deinococcus irradiatisoli]|uniref:TetR/AcrR family transcriptional regulator n=1 Tax=Deinococcus irradiatisoli TaxID=2202254 RepID=A0A2Z3JEA3_9DEIO|nr:TetR/AcrR family transcriptional regulator [Deinococcus irradiatisoli]AWN23295.1 TetR/AcrR family transcriptional regulator [Deinococcus irradiatisoli]